MSKFEVGQRVRAWFTAGPGEKCKITKVLSPVCLELLDHEGKHAYAHPRQCVRLVRKKPCPPQGERVEFWVPLSENPMKISPLNSGMIGISRAALVTGWRMVELKPGETILSRDKLAKAWDIVSAKSHGVSTCFGHLAEALGLGAK